MHRAGEHVLSFFPRLPYLRCLPLFFSPQKPNTILEPDYKPVVIKNVSTLPVNVLLSTGGPFFLCENDKSLLPSTPEVTGRGCPKPLSGQEWGHRREAS